MVTRPTIRRIDLDGPTLNVSWYRVRDSSITAYVVKVLHRVDTVFTSKKVEVEGNPPQLMSAALDLPGGALDTNTCYFAQVSSSPGNQSSQPVQLITRLPVLRTGYFDGTDFYLEWEPSTQASEGYYLKLYRSDSENPFTATVPAAGNWWGKIGKPTLSAGQWKAQVSAVATVAIDDDDINVYAANAASPLLATQQPLTFSSTRFQRGAAGGFITAQWTALGASTGVTRYRLQSYGPDGTPGAFADVPGVTSTSGTLPLLDSFAPGSTLRLLALNDAGMGVSTPANPVLTTLPVLTAVAFAPDNKAVNVAWRVDPAPAVTGFRVEIYNPADPSKSSRTQDVSGSTSRSAAFTSLPAGGLDATQTWAVRVWATGAAGVVPAVSESWPLPATAPTLTALGCQGSELNVSWSLPDNAAQQPAAYVVSLTDGGKTAAGVRVEGARTTQARLLVPDATKSYSVTVAAVGPGDAQGPFSPSVAPLVAQVTGLTAVTNAISGKCTLSWAWAGAVKPGSYRLDFSDGTSATPNDTSHTLAGALPAGADLSVCITPLASKAGLTISGPTSAPHRLPTLRATVVDARFGATANAMTVSATWRPLPGATGYRVTLIDSEKELAGADAPAEATQGSVNFPGGSKLESTKRYLVLVQGQWGKDLGLPGNQPIFDPGFYVSTSADTAPPFVYPATLITTATSANNAMNGEPLELYLPDIGIADGELPVTQGAFTLAANDRNKAVYPRKLTISNGTHNGTQEIINKPWAFKPGESIRNGLASNVRDFLQKVENAGAVPWAIALIQQILARLLPQTFAEQLYYNFGLTFPGMGGASQGSVDLRPGMVLRVVPNPYQTVPGQTQGSWLTGYVGAACIDYDVGSLVSASGAWSVGFDTFIGQLVGNGALIVSAPFANAGSGQEQGVAEAADLYFPAFRQSFYRLFVPNKLLTPTGVGSVMASDNFVLAAAPKYSSLCATTAPSASSTVAYFRGRAVLKACLRVTLDGAGLVVPVGTTLANLLEQSGRLPPAVPPPLMGVRIERGLGGAVLDPNAPSHPASMAVHVDWHAADAKAYGPGWGVASLPLLPGDRITVE